MQNKQKIVIAVTGASGAMYTKLLLDALYSQNSANQVEEVAVVITQTAKEIWLHEIGDDSYNKYPAKYYRREDFNAPFASGSSTYRTMIICPCSMGILGRIANGISDDLITRTADVMLKERRKLIMVLRETPYNLIHIANMKKLTLAGAVICPANPSFYSKPQTIKELSLTVVDRIFDLAGIYMDTFRWGEQN